MILTMAINLAAFALDVEGNNRMAKGDPKNVSKGRAVKAIASVLKGLDLQSDNRFTLSKLGNAMIAAGQQLVRSADSLVDSSTELPAVPDTNPKPPEIPKRF